MPVAIAGILTHRADVSRVTITNENGLAVKVWSVIALNQPCLLTAAKQHPTTDVPGSLSQDASTEQRPHGLLLAMPSSPMQPADRLTIRVPGRPPATYLVLSNPTHVDTPTGPHHRELAVTAVP